MPSRKTTLGALAAIAMAGLGCATGTSDSLPEASAEAGTPDTASQDSGPAFDAGLPETGHGIDGGEAGAVDAPAKDSSASDASPTDHAGPDVSPKDTSAPDAAPPDTIVPDTSAPDCGKPATDSSATCPFSGVSGALATFNLVGQVGDEASAPVSSVACGVDSTALSRAVTITAVSGTDSINGSNWGTGGSADSTRYYTFTITPAAGCSVTLTSLALDVKASSTGPTTADVATSADGFATHTTSFAGTSKGTTTLSATGSGAIEVRVYGYGATASAGTMRIQNAMTLSGSIL